MDIVIHNKMLEKIVPKLPKTKEAIARAFENCSKKFVTVSNEEFKAHLEKSKSDLASISNDYVKNSWDWVIVKAYYAIHHAANALLVKFNGFYSKDHICAILALKYSELLPETLYQKLRKINAKFEDFTAFDVSYILRKISQYDVTEWKALSKQDAESICAFAKEFVAFVEERCYK